MAEDNDARAAHARIDGHERLCHERWEQLRERLAMGHEEARAAHHDLVTKIEMLTASQNISKGRFAITIGLYALLGTTLSGVLVSFLTYMLPMRHG